MNKVMCVEDLGSEDKSAVLKEDNKKMISAFILALSCALYVINNYDEVIKWKKIEGEK